jgi:hypothetical protein
MNRNVNALAVVQALLIALGLFAWATGGTVMLVLSLIWLLPIIISIELGKSRDRMGWMWGLLLGWLGVLILAIMRPVSTR